MSPEDHQLWKQVTDGVIPLVFASKAAVIRPHVSARGRLFHTTLDLHGLTLPQAHTETRRLVQEGHLNGLRFVTVITGLSGPIRREFPFWVENLHLVRRAETLNGGGAFKLHLVKTKRK